MSAIIRAGAIYTSMTAKRVALEKDMRAQIQQRMDSMQNELDQAIIEAKDRDGKGFTAISREMGCSRQTVWRYYTDAKARLGDQLTVNDRYNVDSKWNKVFSYVDGGAIQIEWPNFTFKIMDQAKFNKLPFTLRARIRKAGNAWVVDEVDDAEKPRMNYNTPADVLAEELANGEDVNAQVVPALNEWSGK